LDKVIRMSSEIKTKLNSNTKLKQKLITEIETIENETSKQASLELVDEQISDWTKGLTSLKHHKELIVEGNIFIKGKEILIENTRTELKSKTELRTVESKKIESLEVELNENLEKLKANGSEDLSTKKDDLVQKEQQWNSFKQYSELYLKLNEGLNQNKIETNQLTIELEKSIHQIVVLTNQVGTQEILVKDQEKIMNLEKSIKSYEADRAKLSPGDECGLCGSTEHPFVTEYRQTDVSQSEQEVEARKVKLKNFTLVLNLELQNKVSLETKKNGLIKSKTELDIQRVETTEKVKMLELDCEISNSSKIQIQLNLVKRDLVNLERAIKVQNELRAKKEAVLVNISTQKEIINSIHSHVARLTEKLKNNKEAQTITHKSIEESNQNCKDLETDLIPKLRQFNYELQTNEQTNIFISEIEKSIANYRLKLKELESKKGELVVLDTKLTNDNAQLKEKLKAKEDLQKLIKVNAEEIIKATEKRQLILPSNLSVEDKRFSLQNEKNRIETQLQLNKTVLQNELEFKTKKETLKTQVTSDNTKLNEEIETLTKQLDGQIIDSDFNSKQDIENGLLTQVEKVRFSKNKEYITGEGIKIETLTAELIKNTDALEQSKKFTIAEEDITER